MVEQAFGFAFDCCRFAVALRRVGGRLFKQVFCGVNFWLVCFDVTGANRAYADVNLFCFAGVAVIELAFCFSASYIHIFCSFAFIIDKYLTNLNF